MYVFRLIEIWHAVLFLILKSICVKQYAYHLHYCPHAIGVFMPPKRERGNYIELLWHYLLQYYLASNEFLSKSYQLSTMPFTLFGVTRNNVTYPIMRHVLGYTNDQQLQY